MAQIGHKKHRKKPYFKPYFTYKGLDFGGCLCYPYLRELSWRHAYEGSFLIMIELTTGVVFLMSSLYGGGQADAHVANIAAQNDTGNNEIAIELSTLKEDKDIEAYIRKEYADTPILVDIARCESRFHQFNADGTVVRGIVNNKDVGIMQINEKYHADTAKKMGINIYSVQGNIAYGKYLYGKYGVSPWSSSSKCWSSELAKK